MKKFGKTVLVSMVILMFAATSAFSQSTSSISALQKGVSNFSSNLAEALPFNSTIGLNWSDAHIGKLFPSLPPHFGIGFTPGFTTMDIGAINDLIKLVNNGSGISLPNWGGMPLPGYVIEARVGGIFLPFDVGFKFGYLDPGLLEGMLGVGVKYKLIGADIRYSLLDVKLLPVKVSVGLGYNYLEGGIYTNLGSNVDYAFGGKTLEVSAPKLGLEWHTKVLEAKAQVSFPLIIVTPYAGVGLSYSWSSAGYNIRSKIKVDGDAITQADINELKTYGLSGISANGFSSMKDNDSFNMRLYGGLSLNVTLVKFDLTAMYNVLGGNWGVTLGTRFQL